MIIVGNEKDSSEDLASTEFQHRKPKLYRLKKILDSAMGIYSLPTPVVEIILMPYLRINAYGISRMELYEKNVDLGLWGPVLFEDG